MHLPFCAAKCHYCDFFSVPDEGHDIDGMVAAVLREAELRAPRGPRTVFLGGGTPSLLSPDQLVRLLEGLEKQTAFRSSAVEVSCECNPESLDQPKAALLRKLGVTRLSIGFQSLRQETLTLFGRVHDVDGSFRAFDAARGGGFDDLNVDLIYAFPGQTVADWEADLGRVLELGPDHLSAYNLTIEEGTRFHALERQGQLASLDEELELALFEHARAATSASGLDAYEVSNFASSGRECRHNINYWQNGPYVGVGPSAVSKIGTSRTGNVRGIGIYQNRIERAGSAQAWSETPAPQVRLGESWWLGLRLTRGVTPDEARQAAGYAEEGDPALPVAERLREDGLLETRDGRYVLSPRGLPLADRIATEFLVEPE